MDEVIKLLKEAGWYEGRCIDTTPIEEYYRTFGLELHDAAKKFFAEFGLLNIYYYVDEKLRETRPKLINSSRHITTYPEDFMDFADQDDVEMFKAYSQHFNQELLPVFRNFSTDWDYFLSDRGNFFQCGDWQGVLNGNDFKQSIYSRINRILSGGPVEEVPETDYFL